MNNIGPWGTLMQYSRMDWVSRVMPLIEYRPGWTDATNGADRPTRVEIACGWAELHCLGLLWRLGNE
jgi:hypothetical protein